MNKIDEIKQALAAATPGPWSPSSSFGDNEEPDGIILWAEVKDSPGSYTGICEFHPDTFVKDEDVNLIAKAPEYIAYLLEEVEKWKKLADAKVVFASNGNDDYQYELQEDNIRLRKELEEKEILLSGRQYTINRLKEHNEEIATMGIRQGEQIARLLQSEKKLRKQLEEARKIRFPRQADGEGGWTIDYGFLERIGVTMLRESDHTIDMEDIELVLLTLEIVLGQEGEGNQ